MEEAIIKYITQGGLFGIVCVILFFYRRDFLVEKQSHKEDKEILLAVLQNNTTVMTRLESAFHEMTNRARYYDHTPIHRKRLDEDKGNNQ